MDCIIRGEPTPGQQPELDDLDLATARGRRSPQLLLFGDPVAHTLNRSSRSVVTAGRCHRARSALCVPGMSALSPCAGADDRMSRARRRGYVTVPSRGLRLLWRRQVAEELDGLGPCVCPCDLVGGKYSSRKLRSCPGRPGGRSRRPRSRSSLREPAPRRRRRARCPRSADYQDGRDGTRCPRERAASRAPGLRAGGTPAGCWRPYQPDCLTGTGAVIG
jgi:hypothetical protein